MRRAPSEVPPASRLPGIRGDRDELIHRGRLQVSDELDEKPHLRHVAGLRMANCWVLRPDEQSATTLLGILREWLR